MFVDSDQAHNLVIDSTTQPHILFVTKCYLLQAEIIATCLPTNTCGCGMNSVAQIIPVSAALATAILTLIARVRQFASIQLKAVQPAYLVA